jgi:thioredoxin 2
MKAAALFIVTCPNCGAQNRVRPDAALDRMPVCGKCKQALPPPTAEPVTVTDANFSQVVEKSAVPVLLDMWAAWCGPCRMIAPTIEGLARELAGKVLVGKLDVDANNATAARFGVQSIPTLLILKGGKEVGRLVGAQSRDAILRGLQPHL